MSWQSHKLSDIPGVRHAFLDVHESALFDKNQIVDLKQVHGRELLHFTSTPTERPHADGVFTTVKGQKVGIVTADCLPVLMASRDGRCIASIHAGWRGTAAGIVEQAVDAFMRQGIAAEDIIAAIGPHIRPCCYEVSAAFYDDLQKSPCAGLVHAHRDTLFYSAPLQPNLNSAVTTSENSLWFDLPAFCLLQLKQAGVLSENVEVLETCTYCTPETLGSFRRRTHFPATRTQQMSWIEKEQ